MVLKTLFPVNSEAWKKHFMPGGELLLLLLILILGGTLRFKGLADRGIFLSDEGYYLGGAKTIHAILEYGWKSILQAEPLPRLSQYLFTHGGGYPDTAKPGYYLLLTLSFLLFGAKDFAGLFLSAFFGTLTILLTFLVGKAISDTRVGLWAALILAVSPYHINYSRSALSIATSIFFVIGGIAWYIRWREKIGRGESAYWNVAAAGAFFGFAYACHYNLAPIVLGFIVFHTVDSLFVSRERRNPFVGLKRVGAFGFPVVITLLLLDLPYRLAQGLFAGSASVSQGRPYEIHSYLDQLKIQIGDAGGGGPIFSFHDGLFYGKFLLASEGIVVPILGLLGVMYVLWKSLRHEITLSHMIIVGVILFQLSFFSLYGVKVGRSIAPIIPCLALAAAFGIEKILHSLECSRSLKTAGVVLLVCFITGTGLVQSATIVHARSMNAQVFQFIEAHHAKCISAQPPVATFYLGRDHVYPLWNPTWEEAQKLYNTESYRYLFLDVGKFHSKRRPNFIYQVMNSNLMPTLTLSYAPFYLLAFDALYPPTLESFTEFEQDPTIELYDLKEIFVR